MGACEGDVLGRIVMGACEGDALGRIVMGACEGDALGLGVRLEAFGLLRVD